MRTEFWEIGGAIWTDGRRPEVRIDYTPNFEEWGTHLPMCPSQTHRIHIVINLIGALQNVWKPLSNRLIRIQLFAAWTSRRLLWQFANHFLYLYKLWEVSARNSESQRYLAEYCAKTTLVNCMLKTLDCSMLEVVLITTPHILLNTWGVVDSKKF